MIDTYVEKLCDPAGGAPSEDSRYYEFKGEVRARWTAAVAARGATCRAARRYPDIVVERTVHGPVLARGTLGGQPVAVVSKRSTLREGARRRGLDPEA